MAPRLGRFARLFVVSLVLLAVSPVTAPFSSCSPADLFHDPAPTSGTLLQTKAPGAEPAADCATGPEPAHRLVAVDRQIPTIVSAHQRRAGLDLPLRI